MTQLHDSMLGANSQMAQLTSMPCVGGAFVGSALGGSMQFLDPLLPEGELLLPACRETVSITDCTAAAHDLENKTLHTPLLLG